MAFKMKGNPYKMGTMATKSTMKMGKKSPMKAEGDPKKSEQATTNLLGKLDKFGTGEKGDPVREKSDRDVESGSVRYSDLPSMDPNYTPQGKDPIMHNPANKKELEKRKSSAQAEQAVNRAQSMEDYIKSTSKSEAAVVKAKRVAKEKAAAAKAKNAENQRLFALGEKGRKKERKDIKKANKKNNKALEKAAKKGKDKPVFTKKKK